MNEEERIQHHMKARIAAKLELQRAKTKSEEARAVFNAARETERLLELEHVRLRDKAERAEEGELVLTDEEELAAAQEAKAKAEAAAKEAAELQAKATAAATTRPGRPS